MDSNRAHEDFYRAHPDWFAVDAAGKPYRAGELYVTCVNSPYYDEYIPAILREIVERYHPEGFTDNSWSGLGRGSICYCEHCRRKFRERSGQGHPAREELERPGLSRVDSLELRPPAGNLGLEQPHHEGGGRAGLHLGRHEQRLASAASARASATTRRSASARTSSCSTTSRAATRAGFQHNGEAGKLIHGLLGWDKLDPGKHGDVSGGPAHVPPGQQARAGGADVDARRLRRRHAALVASRRRLPRRPPHVSHRRAGLSLAQGPTRNSSSTAGRSRPSASCGRSRTPISSGATTRTCWSNCRGAASRRRSSARAFPICRCTPTTSTAMRRSSPLLVLPNLGAMSDAQVASVRRFVERGGGLLATGESSLFNEWGDPRPDFALADLFGAHVDRPAARRRRRRSEEERERHRPHLSAAQPRTAAPAWTGRRPATSPPSPASATRCCAASRKQTSCRSAACWNRCEWMPGAQVLADFRARLPDLPAGDRLDARAEDGHSRPDSEHDRRRRTRRVPAGRPRPPLRARQPARPRRPAGEPGPLGRQGRHPALGRRRRA